MRTHSQWAPLDGLSILCAIGDRKLGFQKHERKLTFFEILKTFIPRRKCEFTSRWVHLTVFPCYIQLVNENWGFKKQELQSAFFGQSKTFIVMGRYVDWCLSGWVGVWMDLC